VTSNPTTIPLKPCPFCGGMPEKDGYGFYHKGDESLFIRCRNRGCRVNPSVTQDQSEYGKWDIDEDWNTRAEPAIPLEDLRRVQEELEGIGSGPFKMTPEEHCISCLEEAINIKKKVIPIIDAIIAKAGAGQ
jgi:Restriction alleviation protein Lar